MTRGTFIGGEGSRFLHGDAERPLVLPAAQQREQRRLADYACVICWFRTGTSTKTPTRHAAAAVRGAAARG